MAALSKEIKSFIVQALACFDTPSQVSQAVQDEFGIKVSRQQCESHDPTKASGKDLAAKWIVLFHDTRKRFREESAEIPIANRSFRLRALGRMAERAEGMKNIALAAQIMEQAAKESGDMYTNRQKLDHTSSDGSMTPKPQQPVDSELIKALVDKLID